MLTDKNELPGAGSLPVLNVQGVASGDKTIIRNAAYCSAKAASILNIPVILSAINPAGNGGFMPEIARLFPGQEVFSRKVLNFDAFEDERTWVAAKDAGRRKRVISGLWTSMCFTYILPSML